jgi:O-antigen ligase
VALVDRPTFPHAYRLLDFALVAALLATAAQLVPVPPRLRFGISPATRVTDRTLQLQVTADPESGPRQPLSLDADATAIDLALGTALVLCFWIVRTRVARGGLRDAARAVGGMGLVLALVALAQHKTAPQLLYWYWHPVSPGATPFGPFVNRNDLATWIVMALPLTIGYGITRLRARHGRDGRPIDVAALWDGTTAWLAVSICLMAATLLVTVSRSGLIGLAVGLAAFTMLSRGRTDARGRAWLAVGLTVIVAVAASYMNIGALTARVDEAFTQGIGGRRAIWGETWPMVSDFWRTGVGVGAYERGMLVYQQSPRDLIWFNHAHNEYLQLAAEGGVLLGVPMLVALAAALWIAARRLREDVSAAYWLRAGAVSGLLAVLIQSIWETGLRMPANAVLFVILAAIAVRHQDGAVAR